MKCRLFTRYNNLITVFASGFLLVLAAGCKPSSSLPSGTAVPLGFAWTCASAITNDSIDLSDRCQARKTVALAYLSAGDVETARQCAVEIEDYNKGMALAAIAEWLIAHGQAAKADAMLPEIEACGLMAIDWQRDYLRSAIIHIQALLGKDKKVVAGAAKFNAHSNLGGDVAANLALMLARTGRVEEATCILNNLAKTNGMETAGASVRGYLDLAALGRLDRSAVTQAVVNAWDAAGSIKPYRRWDLQLQVIEAMTKQGFADEARKHLSEVASNVVAAVKLPPDIHASLICQGALLWNRLGDPAKSAALRGEAEKTIQRNLEEIFQPGAIAKIAEVFAENGDIVQARNWYRRALELATGLENRRPRALAGVEVGVSLAGHKEVMDAGIQKQLESLDRTFDATQP